MHFYFLLLSTPLILYTAAIYPLHTRLVLHRYSGTVRRATALASKAVVLVTVVALMLVLGEPLDRLLFDHGPTTLMPPIYWPVMAAMVLLYLVASRYARRHPKAIHFLARRSNLADIPRRPTSRWAWIAAIIATAIIEEILYRSFLTYYLESSPLHTGELTAIAISSLVFALSRLEEGWVSMVEAGLLGYALGSLFLSDGGSIVPVMIIRGLFDLRGLVFTSVAKTSQYRPGARRLRRSRPA